MTSPSDMNDVAAGVAALSICESLLLALIDLKIISEKDFADVLQDATETHRNAAVLTKDAAIHLKVAAIIKRIRPGVEH